MYATAGGKPHSPGGGRLKVLDDSTPSPEFVAPHFLCDRGHEVKKLKGLEMV